MSSKTVTLQSSEGEAFEVVEAVAMQSQTIKHMIEDECADGVIPVPNVTSKILAKVIEYCKKHVESPKTDDRSADYELKTWDADFVKVDQATLSDLLLAAKFLEINSLLNLTWRKVKEMIQGKTPEEIRKMFDMKIDPESLPYLVTVTLKSSDGELFKVMEAVAVESQTIKHMIEDGCADGVIPVPNVTSKILAKVIKYCHKHVESRKTDDRNSNNELKTWDADFFKVDQATLFDLILAANYLNIKSLLDMTCQTVADMLKEKTPQEIRNTFNPNLNGFTPEEEEEVRRENAWAFE